jgi:hypothetical protein
MSKLDSIWVHGEFLFKMGCKFIFLAIFRSPYMHLCGQNCLRVERQSAKIEVCFAERVLDFYFFSTFVFAHSFAWCCLQCDYSNLNAKFFISFKKITSFIFLEFWARSSMVTLSRGWVQTPLPSTFSTTFHNPHQQKEFELTCIYKSKGEIWTMFVQLDSKVMCKKFQKI